MSSQSSLVSILVASYNNEKYIKQTLDSIVQQTYHHIEIIIVDDCSKDNSAYIIQKWISENDVHTIFIQNEVNLGVCRTFNKALGASKGKYITIIGSDDTMVSDRLTNQVSLLNSTPTNVGAVYSDAFLIGPNDEKYFGRFIQWHKHFFEIPQHDIFETLLKSNFIPIMSVLWKRECFDTCGHFDETLIYEDYDMLLRVSSQYEFIFSDSVSVNYRVHPANMHNKLQSLPAVETNFRIFYKLINVRDGRFNTLVKASLDYYLLKLYELKSSKLSDFYAQYRIHFKADKIMDFALRTGLPYYKMAKIGRFLRGYTK